MEFLQQKCILVTINTPYNYTHHHQTEQVITEIYNITHDDLYGQENTHQTDLENVQINLTPPAYNDGLFIYY